MGRGSGNNKNNNKLVPREDNLRTSLKYLLTAAAFATASAAVTPVKAETKLSICYINHPVQVASADLIASLAKKQGINLERTAVSYTVYLPKITQMLSAGATDQCDIIWNNDDWGQDLAQYLLPLDDLPEVNNVAEGQLFPFLNAAGKTTAVSMTTTAGIFYYRKDLVAPNEVPKTWAELVSMSQKLQKAGKVRWGYVGGMSYTNTFFSFWWTLWNNECDIFSPLYERDNKKLAAAGWKPMIADACQVQTAEFWWDALNKDKISPPGMTSYSRDEANAIFQAGDAAFTVADTVFLGQFNDPKKSRVAGKVGMARFPKGPMGKGHRNWIDIWGWSIPKAIPAERQAAAKKLLSAMLLDYQGQIEVWNKTGGPPPNTKAWPLIPKDDENWKTISTILFDSEHVHDAYYYRNWTTTHKIYSDTLITSVKGSREDIPKTLKAAESAIHESAAKSTAE